MPETWRKVDVADRLRELERPFLDGEALLEKWSSGDEAASGLCRGLRGWLPRSPVFRSTRPLLGLPDSRSDADQNRRDSAAGRPIQPLVAGGSMRNLPPIRTGQLESFAFRFLKAAQTASMSVVFSASRSREMTSGA